MKWYICTKFAFIFGPQIKTETWIWRNKVRSFIFIAMISFSVKYRIIKRHRVIFFCCQMVSRDKHDWTSQVYNNMPIVFLILFILTRACVTTIDKTWVQINWYFSQINRTNYVKRQLRDKPYSIGKQRIAELLFN